MVCSPESKDLSIVCLRYICLINHTGKQKKKTEENKYFDIINKLK